MKKLLLTAAFLAAGASVFAAGSIKWKSSYENALSEAKASHKLVMVDFYTDWCTWCKKLDADTYPAPAVEQEAENFVAVKVNAEKEGKTAADKYKVNGYPTILFVQPDGTQVWKIAGYLPAEDFAKQMHLAATVQTQVPALEATLKTKPADADTAAQLIPYYSGQSNLDKVAAMAKILDAGNTAKPETKADAYNAAGDAFQNAADSATSPNLDKAIGYFQKAIATTLPHQTAYARISIAECYLQGNKPAQAKPFLQALVDMGKDAGEYATQAKQILDQIK